MLEMSDTVLDGKLQVSSITNQNTNYKVGTNKTCVNYALKKLMPLLMRLKKLIARQLY